MFILLHSISKNGKKIYDTIVDPTFFTIMCFPLKKERLAFIFEKPFKKNGF